MIAALERSLVISSVTDPLANCCLSLRSALGPVGELRNIVFIQYNWGGDTISTRCVFNRTGVMVSRDGERKQQERADCGSGLIPSQDDNHPTPAPPQPLRPHSFFLFASKLPGPHPVYASKPYAKEFNILYIFSGLQKKRCSLEGTREKNQIKKQLCIRKPEALK